MTRTHLPFVLTATLVSTPLFATDHMVAVGGSGSIFPNIGSAIAAAVNGDRIIVQPGSYPPFTVDRSVDILALSPNNPFTVAGNIAVLASANLNVTLVGAHALGTLTFTVNAFSPITAWISATGCTFTRVDVSSAVAYLNLHACTIQGSLTFARGSITGCSIKGDPAQMLAGASVVRLASGTSSASIPQRRNVVGNVIGELLSPTFIPSVLTLETDAPFTCSNNFVHASSSAAAKPVVKTKKPEQTYMQITLVECVVSSFSISGGSSSKPWLEDSVSMFEPGFTALLMNNFIVNELPFTGSATCFPQAYNVVTNASAAIDPITGQPTPGSPAINAGDPSTAYLDLDLSRNDAGCYGGSWSMANFITAGTGPRITLVHAPRTTVGGSAIPVTATGFQR